MLPVPGMVTLLYRPDAPAHYVARLGRGGWCEGWGWDAEAAIEDLARVVEDVQPTDVPHAALAAHAALAGWLQRRVSCAELEEE
jgi:hypothetical protein